MSWTEERTQRAVELRKSGMSSREIAATLGDTTAGAVETKLWRIKAEPLAVPSVWTDDRVDRLKKLWADGLSCSVIGERLGVSRNAVIGKVHRLKLASRKTVRRKAPSGESIRRAKSRRRKPRVKSYHTFNFLGRIPDFTDPEPLPEGTPVDPPPEERIQIADLTQTTCRWPVDNPGEPGFGFCGRKCRPDQPYCTAHMEVATK